MSLPRFDVLTGMRDYFLSQAAVKAKIGARLYDTVAEERIAALEDLQREMSPRMGTCVEYHDLGGGAAQNVDAESAYNVIQAEFRFYAFKPSEARELFQVFYECFTGNRYRTTALGVGKWNERVIKMANWDLDTMGIDFDDTLRVTVLNCVLKIRFET